MRCSRIFYATTMLFLIAGLCAGDEIPLVTEGVSPYRIVVPDEGGKVVRHAAEEFQNLLKEISGAVLPIVSESTAGDGPAILIGAGKRVQKTGLPEEAAKLGPDGVLLKTVGPDLVLLGQNGRGQVYAVYELFERWLGVRFLASDCTVMPRQKTVKLPDLDYRYAPPFLYRHIWTYEVMNPYVKGCYAPILAQRMRLGATLQRAPEEAGGCIWTKPFSHSFNEMLPAKEYYADHPEYFALVQGKRVCGVVNSQLCLSNPDVLKICTKKVLDWCAEDPGPEVILSICPNDGNEGWCECEKCAAVFQEEGTQMGPVLRFANAIADEVAKQYPGKKLCVFPYAATILPPAHTKPRENVWAYYCHVGCYSHGFEECDLGSNIKQLLEQWRELAGGRLFFHEYMANYGHYLAPIQNLKGLVKDLRYVAAHGVKGVSAQGQWNCPGCELVELRTYLVAKLLWDPNLDAMALRREFCRGFYGEAGDDVLQYLDLLDVMAEDKTIHGFGNHDPSRTVKPQFVAEGLQVLNKAKEKADSPEALKRVERLILSLWYMQLAWPDRYHLDVADAPKMLDEFRRITAENDITHIHESIDPDYAFPDLRVGPNMSKWLDDMAARYALAADKSVVFDLCLLLPQATCRNSEIWRLDTVHCMGRKYQAILHHPAEKGFGDAVYELQLPKIEAGENLVLKFGAAITAASEDGVQYAVLIDGKELCNAVEKEPLPGAANENSVVPPPKSLEERELDITPWAGKTVKLTLRVGAVGNSNDDWFHWVQPRIILKSALNSAF